MCVGSDGRSSPKNNSLCAHVKHGSQPKLFWFLFCCFFIIIIISGYTYIEAAESRLER